MNIINRILLFFWTSCTFVCASAQTLTGAAPSNVAVGEKFRLTYTVNTQNASDFRAGSIPNELEVLIGPDRSMQSSYQMNNGHTSSSSSITYTYIMCASKNGTYTISPAHIVVDGKTISSNSLTIKVSGSAQINSGSSQQHRNEEEEIRDAGSQISDSDLFIKVNSNKNRVYEQEPILLTYKVYTLVGLTSLRGDMPDLKSFYTQEVDLPQQKSFSVETLNGRTYKTTIWSQYVLFPQMTGKLEIPSTTFEGIVVQQNRNIDPFEAFFNGGSDYIEVKKKIVAPGIEIQVDPLPERPANFSGGVGTFRISSSLDKKNVETGDTVSVNVKVSGIGNISLLDAPILNLPDGFDSYDIEITDSFKITSDGEKGDINFVFKFIPCIAGDYEIPAAELTYFDIKANKYQTIKANNHSLRVTGAPISRESKTHSSSIHSSSIIPWIVILLVSLGGLFFLVKAIKKKK